MDSMYSAHRVNYQLRAHRRDSLIEFIKALLLPTMVMYAKGERKIRFEQYLGVFRSIEQLVDEHRERYELFIGKAQQGVFSSKLRELVPEVGIFFTSLPLTKAFTIYDEQEAITARNFIPPSFNDIRHVLNIAQLFALRKTVKLITFDGDQTLYQDGGDFHPDSALVVHLISLLEKGVFVALVTAAGYENNPEKYESRLSGLLAGFKAHNLSQAAASRFFVLGGECNFLYKCKADYKLEVVRFESFATDEMLLWGSHQIVKVLDIAEASLRNGVEEMNLNYQVLRKARGVGLVCSGRSADREQLDELALRAKHDVNEAHLNIRVCAFNGGQDVWVDIGDKLVGVQALQGYLQCKPEETLHVGDQFLSTGNDIATRRACCTVWVSNPEETDKVLSLLEELSNLEGK
mmetsp:Transcript_26481/g.103144  ORF Transcript_26481/g.103144 Transcript_26481/m.103144 type:complete len:405 (-) Transcript_26481:1695-2909(-)